MKELIEDLILICALKEGKSYIHKLIFDVHKNGNYTIRYSSVEEEDKQSSEHKKEITND